jgi:hypothetical protein
MLTLPQIGVLRPSRPYREGGGMLHRATITLAFVGALASASTANASTSNALQLHVLDDLGASIGNAFVFVRQDGATWGLDSTYVRLSDQTKTTDHLGYAAIDLPPGFYDVCAFSTGFTARCAKVLIKQAPVKLDLRLQVDPIVANELGDRIPTGPAAKRR